MTRLYILQRNWSVFFKEERDIQLYCDIHGHSRKKNAFMYGWEYGAFEYDNKAKNAILRLFPAFMEQKNKWFRFKDCSFKVEKSKEETARIVWFKEIGIRHSFTLESTFYGRDRTEEDTEDQDMHMNVEDFKMVGEDLAKCFVNFCPIPKYKKKINFLYRKFLKIIHDKALKWCLPLNNDRYLKKNYRKSNISKEVDGQNDIEELGPNLEELEGKPIEPEYINEGLSSSSSENNFEFKKPVRINKNKFLSTERVREKPNEEYKTISDKSISEGEISEEDSFSEFDNVLNNVEIYEHKAAIGPSEVSDYENTDSDDQEDNIFKKKLKSISGKKSPKKVSKQKLTQSKSTKKINKLSKKLAKKNFSVKLEKRRENNKVKN